MKPEGSLPPPVFLEQVESTHDVLHALALEGAAHGATVVAERQQGGRGSRGRRWISERGGLWMSVLLRSPAADDLGRLPVRVAMHVASVLHEVTGIRIALKWPNDLLLDGCKVGGILCEARWAGDVPSWVSVGLGLNVSNRAPEGTALPSVSLGSVAPISPGRLAVPLRDAVLAAASCAGPLSSREIDTWRAMDALFDAAILEPASGFAAGIDRDGALIVRGAAGEHILVTQPGVEVAR